MKLFTTVLFSVLVSKTFGFSPPKPTTFQQQQQSIVSLNAFAHLVADNEEDATYLLSKARECAFSDSCSVDDAEYFLREVVHLESGCAAGTLAGHELCDNQDYAAEIVANLRAKIENKENSLSSDFDFLSPIGTFTESLVIIAMLLFCSVVFSTVKTGADAVPFTFQEWMWALQGGYLPRMFVHFAANGGL